MPKMKDRGEGRYQVRVPNTPSLESPPKRGGVDAVARFRLVLHRLPRPSDPREKKTHVLGELSLEKGGGFYRLLANPGEKMCSGDGEGPRKAARRG